MGYLIKAIYEFCNNYGLAIIVFTIIVKIILIPLGINQQKTSAKLAQIQPLMNELNKKYKNDKEKLSKETMELYQKYHINPMSGCLPLLLQFPILIGLYQVIQKPLTFILRLPAEKIQELMNAYATANNIDDVRKVSELAVAGQEGLINFGFLGLDLSQTPQMSHISPLWIIPIIATLITFATSYITKWLSGGAGNEQSNTMMNSMNIMMPIMTLMITFTLPAGIGLYWFMSSLLSIIQQIILTKYYQKKYQTEMVIEPLKTTKKEKKKS